jgi:hypothetical protein
LKKRHRKSLTCSGGSPGLTPGRLYEEASLGAIEAGENVVGFRTVVYPG